MPGKDGMGPSSRARCGRSGKAGAGKGRGGKATRSGKGPGGNCLCPSCGIIVAHPAGVACSSMMCSWCGSSMIRVKKI